jgi:hypothetical protein
MMMMGSGPSAPPTQGGGAEPGTANLWVDTDGGTCVDNASAVTYTSATACGSLDAANDIADCDDTILIKGGTYGDQAITGDRTCGSATWTAGASRGVTMVGGVLFEVAPGESVTAGEIGLRADWVELSRGDGLLLKFVGDSNVNANSSNTTNNTIMRGVYISGDLYTNNDAGSGLRVNNFALVDSELGDFNGADPQQAEPVYMQTCGNGCSGDTIAQNIYFDGIDFHDISIPAEPDPHIEVIRIDGGSDNVHIRNSNFYDNITTNTAVIFTTWGIYGGGSGAIRPTNIHIYNNYFNSDMENGVLFELGGAGACVNFTIKYNTFAGGGVFSGNCTPTNMKIVANLGAKSTSACYGSSGNYIKNVWQHTSNVACGTDTWVNGTSGSTSALGLGGTFGFDLQAGSAALQAGETTNCPATDHDGGTRPDPGATNCDAGADERG